MAVGRQRPEWQRAARLLAVIGPWVGLSGKPADHDPFDAAGDPKAGPATPSAGRLALKGVEQMALIEAGLKQMFARGGIRKG